MNEKRDQIHKRLPQEVGGYRLVRKGPEEAVVLQSRVLDLPGLRHGFATRLGGVSQHSFASLNFGLKGGDSPESVQQNLRRLACQVGFEEDRLFRVAQVHGRRVVVVGAADDPPQVLPEAADALATACAGNTLGVRTADCVPVLLVDPRNEAVAAAHAGWRGVVGGVLEASVGSMVRRFDTAPEDLRAALGPSIGPCCFEVGEEVARQFEGFKGCVCRPASGPRPHVDLQVAIRQILRDQGLRPENVDYPQTCTHCREDLFFSYRRDGEATGHHLSVVGFC